METLTRYNDFEKLKKKSVLKNTASQINMEKEVDIENFLLNIKKAKLKKNTNSKKCD